MEDQGAGNIQNPGVGFPGSVPTPQTNEKKNWKWLIVLVLFLVVIGGITFFVFKNSKQASEEAPIQTSEAGLSNPETPQPTSTPAATPADKTKIKIKVLNGTGVPGDAGALSDELKKLGYTNVTTGNADNQSASADASVVFDTNVSSDVAAEIAAKLRELYNSVSTSSSSLSDADIQITTGLGKGQTPAPRATSTTSETETPTPTPTSAQ